MINTRENIYAALFKQVQDTVGGNFNLVSRRWQDPSQIAPADRPAIFQVQTGETAITSQSIAGLPLKWMGKIDLVIYASGDSDSSSIPSTELNNLLDSVESAIMPTTKGLPLTLGGMVYTARIDGKVEIVENVMGAMAMAVVPIIIIQGS
jgi:hypothetical protein